MLFSFRRSVRAGEAPPVRARPAPLRTDTRREVRAQHPGTSKLELLRVHRTVARGVVGGVAKLSKILNVVPNDEQRVRDGYAGCVPSRSVCMCDPGVKRNF